MYVSGTDIFGLTLYLVLATVLSEILAVFFLLITMNRRHTIWLERLIMFPLGNPDHLVIPAKEMLTSLKLELQKNGFSEGLLDETDVLSLAKAKELFRHEDDFAWTETTSLNSFNVRRRNTERKSDFISRLLLEQRLAPGSPEHRKTEYGKLNAVLIKSRENGITTYSEESGF